LGEDVPGVGGDDEGGDEVDLGRGVGAAVAGEGADVGAASLLDGAFDLDADEASVVVPFGRFALSGQAMES
jgi:hypothetical protein